MSDSEAGHLLSAKRGPSWRSVLTEIGTVTPHCPYCGHAFDGMPQRKRECPGCQGVFCSRKRAVDGVKVLLTEAEALDGEAQVALLTLVGQGELTDNDVDRAASEFNRRTRQAPTADELVAECLRALALAHAESWNWRSYRGARFGIYESCRRRGLLDDALRLLLEVSLIDLNGPRNLGTKDPTVVRRFPPFDPSRGFLVGDIASHTVEVMETLGLSLHDTRAAFDSVATTVKPALKLPRSVGSCWEELSGALAEASGQK